MTKIFFLPKYFILVFIVCPAIILSQSQKLSADAAIDTVLVGYSTHVFQNVNLEDAKAACSVLLQKVIHEWKKDNHTTTLKLYDQTNSIVEDCNNDKIDIIALTSSEYITLKNQINITPFVTYITNDRTLDKILLLTRYDSGIQSIKDLCNKKVIIYKPFNDKFSITEIWFKTVVLQNKENYKKYFLPNVVEVNKSARAIADVFFKKADAIVVSEKEFNASIMLNPQLEKQLKILDSSKPILYSVLCYTDRIKILRKIMHHRS
jgi:ABC-type phosphate/phosphonate transport system substrate-binding protein